MKKETVLRERRRRSSRRHARINLPMVPIEW
jgi:hypothetical protein